MNAWVARALSALMSIGTPSQLVRRGKRERMDWPSTPHQLTSGCRLRALRALWSARLAAARRAGNRGDVNRSAQRRNIEWKAERPTRRSALWVQARAPGSGSSAPPGIVLDLSSRPPERKRERIAFEGIGGIPGGLPELRLEMAEVERRALITAMPALGSGRQSVQFEGAHAGQGLGGLEGF